MYEKTEALLLDKLPKFTFAVNRGEARNGIQNVCLQSLPDKGYFRSGCRINELMKT